MIGKRKFQTIAGKTVRTIVFRRQKTKIVLFPYFLAKKPSPMGIQTKALIKWYQITQLIK